MKDKKDFIIEYWSKENIEKRANAEVGIFFLKNGMQKDGIELLKKSLNENK